MPDLPDGKITVGQFIGKSSSDMIEGRHVPAEPRLASSPPGPIAKTLHSSGGQIDPYHDKLSSLRSTDKAIVGMMKDLDSGNRYAAFVGFPFNTQGDLLSDPMLYSKQIARLGADLTRTGLHAAMQVGLFALNRRGKIWNPLAVAPVPGTELFVPAALDQLFINETAGNPLVDVHAQLAMGVYTETHGMSAPPFVARIVEGGRGMGPLPVDHDVIGANSQDESLVDDIRSSRHLGMVLTEESLRQKNAYTPDFGLSFGDKPTFTIGSLFQKGIEDHEMKVFERGGPDVKSPLANMFMNPKQLSLSSQMEYRPNPGFPRNTVTKSDDKLKKAAFTNGVIPVRFREDNDHGFVTFKLADRKPKIDDDDAYVPLSFTDLRPHGQTFRTVYFRPFITNLTEEFSPEWGKKSYFGRADPVMTYQGTGRAIQIGFNLTAFSPADVEMIYKKLNWLTSMVYPTYDNDLLYQSGPVVRLRVGDVINAAGPEGARGLPGVIDSLNFDYSESIWELEKDLKVPRNVKVSVTFVVLHDRPIGVGEEGKFGGMGYISDGKFLINGQDSTPRSGGDQRKSINVVNALGSFRTIGGKSSESMNEYEKLSEAGLKKGK